MPGAQVRRRGDLWHRLLRAAAAGATLLSALIAVYVHRRSASRRRKRLAAAAAAAARPRMGHVRRRVPRVPGALSQSWDHLRHACPTARASWGNTTVEVYAAQQTPPELIASLGRPTEQYTDTACLWDSPPKMQCFSCCSGWLPGCAGRAMLHRAMQDWAAALEGARAAPFVDVSFSAGTMLTGPWQLDARYHRTVGSRMMHWGFGIAVERRHPASPANCTERLGHVALMPPAHHSGNIYHWLGEVLEPLLVLSTELGLAPKQQTLVAVPALRARTSPRSAQGERGEAPAGWWDAVPLRYGAAEWLARLATFRSRQSLTGACAAAVHLACPRPACPAHHRLAGSMGLIRLWLGAPRVPLPHPAAGEQPLLLLNNRRPGGTRYITNTAQLLAAAQRQGLWDARLLPMWALKAAEMEPLLRRCGAFVSLHGADIMFALLFLPPLSIVVEMWNSEFVRKEPVYVELGAVAGMQHMQWLWPAASMQLMGLWVDVNRSDSYVWLPARFGAGWKNACKQSNATLAVALWAQMLAGVHALAMRQDTRSPALAGWAD
eukprot:TRINITY_DN11500_c0_g1_i2.p1 TRINITY_DN11500_c0_g1~~TRINITY_DN11500_c0_g1_i2.p1  ORF type:complete len:588 (+),score=115.84 TRINITY_DN11500_c0_g1_i2:120-1766(+)